MTNLEGELRDPDDYDPLAECRDVEVTLSISRGWEVWTCRIPNEIPSDDVEDYVRENFALLDKSLDESEADHYEIDEVVILDDVVAD